MAILSGCAPAWLLIVVPTVTAQCSPQWLTGEGFEIIGGGVQAVGAWTPGGQTPLVVVGGHFASAGPVAAHNIAAWDGHAWRALGSGTNGSQDYILALGVYNGELIAGGSFAGFGATSAASIARWNGTVWQPLGAGVSGSVFAVATYNGELIVGGTFSAAGGQPADCIAAWNGSAWQALGSGMSLSYPPGVSAQVTALCVYQGDLIAGGAFDSVGGLQTSGLARWNGSWHSIPIRCPAGVHAMALYQDDLIIAGDDLESAGYSLVRWDGSQHSQFAPGLGGAADTLAADAGTLYVGGIFFQAGGQTVNNIAAWNGVSWRPLSTGVESGAGVYTSVLYGDQLIVGGSFTTAGGQPSVQLARWGCVCYPNCDNSVTSPTLNVLDFTCFLNRFSAGDAYANCDGSSTPPVLNILDFVCFVNRFAAGCT